METYPRSTNPEVYSREYESLVDYLFEDGLDEGTRLARAREVAETVPEVVTRDSSGRLIGVVDETFYDRTKSHLKFITETKYSHIEAIYDAKLGDGTRLEDAIGRHELVRTDLSGETNSKELALARRAVIIQAAAEIIAADIALAVEDRQRHCA